MIKSYKKFWGDFPLFKATVTRTEFLKGLLLHFIVCSILCFSPYKAPLMIYIVLTFERIFNFCSARLKDAGYASYWGFLSLSGVGVIYVIYLLLFKPSLSRQEGNKYKNIDVVLTDNESGNEISFEVLDEIVYNKENYIVVTDNKSDVPDVIVLKIQRNGISFVSVDNETADNIFNIFKEKNKLNYEFV